jgi:hypothetical protein
MNLTLCTLLTSAGVTAGGVWLIAMLLTLLGRRVEAFTRTPLLDAWVSLLTWVPWVVAGVWGGWIAFAGALAGQFVALFAWCFVHELMHRQHTRGPRIVRVLNRLVGRWQNHLALWVTLVALPGFLFIRFLQIALWWMLVWLLGFPRYRQSEWVNVSRQKFDGLVGHDLIWCLYCDWMTGVYALGAEMLRNVESFWCPIRFYDGKKCENCKLDFPDLDHGWVPPTGTMADVAAVLEEKYGTGERAWFGHPVRLTIRGKD